VLLRVERRQANPMLVSVAAMLPGVGPLRASQTKHRNIPRQDTPRLWPASYAGVRRPTKDLYRRRRCFGTTVEKMVSAEGIEPSTY